MRTFTSFALAAGLAAGLTGSALAQGTTTPRPPSKPAHHGFLSNLFHRPKPGATAAPAGNHMRPMGGSSTAMTGQIIGNKNTHIYHMPGDKGAVPDPKNRVYFRTEAQAAAAGYHRAGSGRAGTKPGMHKGMHPMTPGAAH